MVVKNHKQNTNFQIAYFLAGGCHTPDGAYAMLCELRESRQAAIENYAVSQLKSQAKEIRARRLIANDDEAEQLDGQAELLELNNNKATGKILYEAAVDELNFIDKCILAIEPFCQFRDLPIIERHEATQYDEWKFELIERAENSMLTTGGIPTDHFATMRMHPAFQSDILPRIKEMQQLMQSKTGVEKLQQQIGGSKFNVINQLLQIK